DASRNDLRHLSPLTHKDRLQHHAAAQRLGQQMVAFDSHHASAQPGLTGKCRTQLLDAAISPAGYDRSSGSLFEKRHQANLTLSALFTEHKRTSHDEDGNPDILMQVCRSLRRLTNPRSGTPAQEPDFDGADTSHSSRRA